MLGVAALAFAGLAVSSLSASATGLSGEGLVQVDATVVGVGGGVCNVTLEVTPVRGAPGPLRLPVSAPLAQHCMGVSALQTSSVTMAVSAGRSVLSVVATSGRTLNEDPVFGGDCGPDGSVTVTTGALSQCSLTLYALGGSLTLGAGRPQAPRVIQVVEQVVPPNALPPGAGDPLALLCAASFRLGLVSGPSIVQETAATGVCAQQGTGSYLGRYTAGTGSLSFLTNLAVGIGASEAGVTHIGVRDNFSASGYITTYSGGCSHLDNGGATFTLTTDPLTCTITHTYVGGSLPPRDGLLRVVSSSVGTGTLCGIDVSVAVTPPGQRPGSGTGGPETPLSDQCMDGGSRTQSAGSAQFAVAPGTASLTLRATDGRTLDDGIVWSGDCDPSGAVAVDAGESKVCMLSLYPLFTSVNLDPGRSGETTRLVQVTEQIVRGGATAPDQVPAELCGIHLRLGLAAPSGLSPESTALAVCVQNGEADITRSGDAFSLTDSIDLSFAPPPSGPAHVALRDDFAMNGYLTTYSSGCTDLMDGGAEFDTPADPLTCTITHTYLGGNVSRTDGLLEIDTSVVGHGYVCDATVDVASIGPTGGAVGSPVLAPEPAVCTGRVAGSFTVGSSQLAVAAGPTRLTVSTPSGMPQYATILGGDCASDGNVTVRAGELSKCTLTLYTLAGAFTVVSGTPQTTRLVQVTERIVPNPQASGSSLAELLCGTRFQVGLVDRTLLTAKTSQVNVCAQTPPDYLVAGTAVMPSAVTTLTVTFARTPGAVARLGVTDNFTASNYLTTFSGGCTDLAGEIGELDVGNDPLTCTITHTYIGPATPAPPPTPASTTSVSCPAAGSVAAVDGTMICSVTVGAPAGAPTPSGTVTVTPGNETCNIATDPCQVTVATGATAGTQETVTASFPGQSGLTGSSGSDAVTLTARATAIAMDCQSMSAAQNGETYDDQPVNCTLTVTDQVAPSSFAPDGQVSATAGSDTETCTIDTSTHSCMVTLTSGGLWPYPAFTITSNYPGDSSEFAASNGSEAMSVMHG
jgi:hypothetical protein